MTYSSAILEKYQHGPGFWRSAVSSSLAASLFNTVVYLAAVASGVFASVSFLPNVGGELTLAPIAIVSFMIPLCGFMVFRSINNSRDNAYPLFRNAAWLALVASLFLPMTIANWTWLQILTVQLTHLIVATVTLYGVNQWRQFPTIEVERYGRVGHAEQSLRYSNSAEDCLPCRSK